MNPLIFWTLFCLSCNAIEHNCRNKQENRSTFVWSIKGPSNRHSFLFGTIHVGYDRVWDSVSIKLKEILGRVDTLVLELALHDPSTVEKLVECKQLSSGQTLRRLLPQTLYQRLKKYFAFLRQKHLQSNEQQVNSLISAWEHRRPVWLLFLLYQMSEEQAKQSSVSMLDAYLAQKSQLLRKQLYSIETVEEQCNPLISINEEQITFAINYSLSYLEWTRKNPHRMTSKKSTIEDLIRLYRCGDTKVMKIEGWRLHESGFSLNPDLDEQAKQIDEQLKHDIIDQRNSRMGMRIHDLIKEYPQRSFLFALGAGHFNGEYSLINILRSYGYTVEAVTDEKTIDDYFLGQLNPKHFNELWVRRNESAIKDRLFGINFANRRIYYILIVLISISLFILIIHKISQRLLRVIVIPKYDQIILPNYL